MGILPLRLLADAPKPLTFIWLTFCCRPPKLRSFFGGLLSLPLVSGAGGSNRKRCIDSFLKAAWLKYLVAA